MCSHTNVAAARTALACAAWAQDVAPAYDETAVADLLADLRQLCKAKGIDRGRCNQRAENYFTDEDFIEEDGGASRLAPLLKRTG